MQWNRSPASDRRQHPLRIGTRFPDVISMGFFKKKSAKPSAPQPSQPVQGPAQPQSRTLVKKISLLGDPAVGKTSLIHRFVYEAFDDRYLSTIGAKVTKKCIDYVKGDFPRLEKDTSLNFLIWDIAGQKAFKSVHQTYYVGSEGALIVCDLTRRETLDNLLDWISELFKVVRNVPVVILANKYDIKGKAVFGEPQLRAVASQIRAPVYFTSAKTGLNVERAFELLGELILGATTKEEAATMGPGAPEGDEPIEPEQMM